MGWFRLELVGFDWILFGVMVFVVCFELVGLVVFVGVLLWFGFGFMMVVVWFV